MSFTIRGIGTAVPDAAVTQDESRRVAFALGGEAVEGASWLNVVYANCGVRTRYQAIGQPALVDLLTGSRISGSPFMPDRENPRGPTTETRMRMYAESAPKLAVEAATMALSHAAFDPGSITHIVTVSCTGFVAPGLDHALIRGLGLSPTIERVHVGFMGCHGALNGIKVARAFTNADPTARVLLVAVELCSLHYYMGEEPGKIVANALFADGAAAIVADGADPEDGWQVAATGSCLLPDSAKDMGWTVGDHGFEMTLSKRIPDLIGKHLREWLSGWLANSGHSIESIGSWAIHPGGPKIVLSVQSSLGLTAADLAPALGVLSDFGNMSSPTVLFILDRMRQSAAPRPCVMLGFGPGLTAEAALVT